MSDYRSSGGDGWKDFWGFWDVLVFLGAAASFVDLIFTHPFTALWWVVGWAALILVLLAQRFHRWRRARAKADLTEEREDE
jgi:membrane protein implicated in regulation of membrane protease activity